MTGLRRKIGHEVGEGTTGIAAYYDGRLCWVEVPDVSEALSLE